MIAQFWREKRVFTHFSIGSATLTLPLSRVRRERGEREAPASRCGPGGPRSFPFAER